jgi:polyferredoxin
MLAYGLIAFFVTLPHLRLWGKPIVLLDIVAREFTFFGHTFYPTDSGLLLLLLLTLFFLIMFITAVGGRLWCGWGCPQTVYLEFLFRPIDRLFAGTVGKGGKPRKSLATTLQIGRFAVYLVCSMFLAHTFLSYFIGTGSACSVDAVVSVAASDSLWHHGWGDGRTDVQLHVLPRAALHGGVSLRTVSVRDVRQAESHRHL